MEGFSAADFDIESVLNLFEDIQEELRQEGTKNFQLINLHFNVQSIDISLIVLFFVILFKYQKTVMGINFVSTPADI